MQKHGNQKLSLRGKGKKVLLIIIAILLIGVVTVFAFGSRGLYLQTETTTTMTLEQTWQFFENPQNLATWDKSVAKVEPTTQGSPRVGYTFDTIAPLKAGEKQGQRMSYRIEEYAPPHQTRIRLVGSPMFTYADWIITLEPAAGGTRIIHGVKFVPKFQYSFMTPILYLSQKNFMADMKNLDEALKAYQQKL